MKGSCDLYSVRGKDSPLRAIQRKLNGNYFAIAWVISQPQLISFWWLTA